jgi:hypothetical protein
MKILYNYFFFKKIKKIGHQPAAKLKLMANTKNNSHPKALQVFLRSHPEGRRC